VSPSPAIDTSPCKLSEARPTSTQRPFEVKNVGVLVNYGGTKVPAEDVGCTSSALSPNSFVNLLSTFQWKLFKLCFSRQHW